MTCPSIYEYCELTKKSNPSLPLSPPPSSDPKRKLKRLKLLKPLEKLENECSRH